jgi:tRNA (guanine-N7-)-methyltransferase
MAKPGNKAAHSRRFYGRRSGHRLKPSRQLLYDNLLPTLRVPDPETNPTIDPYTLFDGAVEDVWLEIGFGGGEHLAAQAIAHPNIGLIGCEPFVNGVSSLLVHLDEQKIANVRVHDEDARPLLDALPDASIGRIFLLFPDPWPKKRHNQRRFISPENLDSLSRLLKDNGEFRFGSDHTDYVRWALAHITNDARFRWTAKEPNDWRQRPVDWPETRYEAKALSKGIKSSYLTFKRLPRKSTG